MRDFALFFSGVKMPGVGREGGLEAIYASPETKTIIPDA
jgi:hypothetical protein